MPTIYKFLEYNSKNNKGRKKGFAVECKIPLQQESETSVQLEGELSFPASITNNVKGIVIFAHGSGSSRHGPRNHCMAQFLNNDGLATLLVDLLTQQEEETDIRTQKIQDKIPGLVLNKFNIKTFKTSATNN